MTETQTIILAGGHGTRLASDRPKALTTVGGRPILEHLLTQLATFGLTRISVALGAYLEPFSAHFGLPVQDPDSTPEYGQLTIGGQDFHLRLLDTGKQCDTGGRLGRMSPLIEARFVLCWCDGLSDVSLTDMIAFHRRKGALATVLAVHPPSRFGRLDLDGTRVRRFTEKPRQVLEWINGGIFVLEPAVIERISGDNCSFEHHVMPGLAEDGELQGFRHDGFWQCMDTHSDRVELDQMIEGGQAPWLASLPS